ncbi:hypothetical protein EV368DRAFT_89705 [Lentinula lateritia]|nr:hypothetical protein EV368DRAFT_89705 [Lentinula lateritia]
MVGCESDGVMYRTNKGIETDASTQPSGSFPESKKSQLPFSKDAKPFPSNSATASRIFGSHTDSKIAAENFSASPFRDHPLQKLQVKVRRGVLNLRRLSKKNNLRILLGATSLKQVTFHISLYSKTSNLAAGKAKRPNVSHNDICNAIELKFDELLPTKKVARFSLLQCVLNGGQGTLAALQPSPLTVFTVKDLEIPKGIPAKTYPNFLYISLPTGSEDLDSLNTEGDVKTDGSSRKSKSKARSKARQVDTESDEESVQGDNRFPEASAPALMYHDVSMSSF